MKTLLLLLIPCVAFGRVGEPYAEFKKRVGVEPREEIIHRNGLIEATYKVGDILVMLEAANGAISKETYGNINKAQAQALVDRVEKGIKPKEVGNLTLWLSPRKFRATFNDGMLEITDGKAANLVEQARKEEGDKKTSDAIKNLAPF